jgi:hypothetical protein
VSTVITDTLVVEMKLVVLMGMKMTLSFWSVPVERTVPVGGE